MSYYPESSYAAPATWPSAWTAPDVRANRLAAVARVHALPAQQLEPLHALNAALAELGPWGTPCQLPATRDDWISEAAPAQARACDACLDCPVLFACEAVGTCQLAGVWGGRVRMPDPENPYRGAWADEVQARRHARRRAKAEAEQAEQAAA